MMPVRRFSEQNWLPSVFNDFFGNDWGVKANATAPSVNISEDDRNYVIEVAAPGMTKDDFTVHVDEQNELVISMEKKSGDETKDRKSQRYLRREFSYSQFKQTFTLPDDVERDKITATVENGVLTIDLPKFTPEEKANICKQIEIR